MSYQVWTKDEYTGWKRQDCESLEVAQVELLIALKAGKEPLLTIEVPFAVNIEIKKEKIGEVAKVKTQPGEGPGAKGKSEVRPGDTTAVPKLD